jgi:hypothetical protein
MILCIEHPQVQGKLVQTVTHRGQCVYTAKKQRSKASRKTKTKNQIITLDGIEIR